MIRASGPISPQLVKIFLHSRKIVVMGEDIGCDVHLHAPLMGKGDPFPDLFISDPGVFMTAKRILPEMEIHISTQANNTRSRDLPVLVWAGSEACGMGQGAFLKGDPGDPGPYPRGYGDRKLYSRGHVHLLFRKVPFKQLFYSNTNRGPIPSLRWKYSVVEETRPGEYMPVYENDRGNLYFNSKDLCMIEHIPEMIEAGIDSFKIKGRMKTALYVATVARTYRKAIDDYLESPEKYRENLESSKGHGKCTYRNLPRAFIRKAWKRHQIYDGHTYVKNYTYLGTVEDTALGR